MAASYNVNEGGSVLLSATSSNCDTINWDLNNDGIYEVRNTSTVSFPATNRDGPGSQTVKVQGVFQVFFGAWFMSGGKPGDSLGAAA